MLFSAQYDRIVNYSICGTINKTMSLTRILENVVFYRSWDGLTFVHWQIPVNVL